MENGTISITVQSGDVVWSSSTTDQGRGRSKHTLTLPAAQAGSSVNGGDGSSVITLGEDHGITAEDTVGVFGAFGKRLGMSVSHVDSTTITVTNATGHGDAYPSGTVNVTVSLPTEAPDLNLDGDSMVFEILTCDKPAAIDYLDADDTLLATQTIVAAGGIAYWSEASGASRPITGAPIAKAVAYNAAVTAATMLFVAITAT